MKFPFSMLLDYVRTSLGPDEVGDLLTMAGFELESLEAINDDPLFDVKVMSNRGDGLSVFGLAREVLAKDLNSGPTDLYRMAENRFELLTVAGDLPSTTVAIESDGCTRYACCVLTNVTKRESSPWMQQRLFQAGMRPINLLVDATNYVMLEVGQPLHAFDFDKLEGGRIVVREANPGERLTTLNGVEHELSPGQLMICDAVKPVGVAGVMGGQNSEIDPDTKNVLLESAHFISTSVRRTRKQLELNTEASYRFERSVDPDGVVAAIYRFTSLVREMQPDVRCTAVLDHYPRRPKTFSIGLRPSRASKLLGMKVTSEQAETYLSRLGFKPCRRGDDELEVESPTWRPDIVREVDLVEEIGRVHGYERIPELALQGTTSMGGPGGFELWTDRLREGALRAGLTQTISHSLRDVHPLDDLGATRVMPRNPVSADMAFLRSSLLPGLAEAARRNNLRDMQLFEIGKVFSAGCECKLETQNLAILVYGPMVGEGWNSADGGSSSFFTLKGALEDVLVGVGVSVKFVTPSSIDRRMHPGRQAAVVAGVAPIGFLGQIHPDIARECGLSSETILAEVSAQAAFENRSGGLSITHVSRQPAVRRDLSILVDKRIDFDEIAKVIRDSIGPVLERQWLFDVFGGEGIPAGAHALGIAILLRKSDSTFTDEEANQVRDRAVEALSGLGATMR